MNIPEETTVDTPDLTPTMRGEYCRFQADGARCVFGRGHAVGYHHLTDGTSVTVVDNRPIEPAPAPVAGDLPMPPSDSERVQAVERVLDTVLGVKYSDGTGEGVAADVALLGRQRDEARALYADLARTVEPTWDAVADMGGAHAATMQMAEWGRQARADVERLRDSRRRWQQEAEKLKRESDHAAKLAPRCRAVEAQFEWICGLANGHVGDHAVTVHFAAAASSSPVETQPERTAYQETLSAIWLYVNDTYVMKKLTTEQKDLWADAIDAQREPGDSTWRPYVRWWRDTTPPLCTTLPDGMECPGRPGVECVGCTTPAPAEPTQTPPAWVKDMCLTDEERATRAAAEWKPGDLVEYNAYGCRFTARLVRRHDGSSQSWEATVETFAGCHDHEGVYEIGSVVAVVEGHSRKIDAPAESVGVQAEPREWWVGERCEVHMLTTGAWLPAEVIGLDSSDPAHPKVALSIDGGKGAAFGVPVDKIRPLTEVVEQAPAGQDGGDGA